MDYETRLDTQRQRAKAFARDGRCPHCARPLSFLDRLMLVRGHGWRIHVPILLSDGAPTAVPEEDFNPQTMLWDADRE